MEYLQIYYYLVVIVFCYLGGRYAIKIQRGISEFEKELTDLKHVNPVTKKVFLIIPLLNETKVFKSMVRRFNVVLEHSNQIKVVLVTCDKERVKSNRRKSTIQLCKELALKNPQYVHFHFPSVSGRMAHQVNYGVREIIKKFNPKQNVTYISVYNADSAPHPNTIKTFTKYCSKIKEETSEYPSAMQQVSTFFLNYEKYSNSRFSLLMKSSAFLQSRWSLGYEIGMYKKQNRDILDKSGKLTYVSPAYCVGHGLYIRLDIISKFGLFSEKYTNEDLPLGFFLSLSHIPIFPLPILEDSENPKDLYQLLRQKISWYWGMIEHFEYMEAAIKSKYPIIKTIVMGIKCHCRDSIPWIIRGPNILFLCLYPFLVSPHIIHLIISFCTMLCYIGLPNRIMIKNWSSLNTLNGMKMKKPTRAEEILLIFASVPSLIFISIGPFITLGNYLVSKIWEISKFKPPTTR